MDVSQIGEFGLIARLAAFVGSETPKDLVVGIGDDAAVWRAGDRYLMATTDTMVAGVHFLPGAVSWADVGWKALAVNLSDIGAMGGEPLFALVTLALPAATAVEDMETLYGGLRACAEAYGVAIAGGDIVSAPQVSITVALLGRAQVESGEPLLLLRSAAKEGDVVAVSGSLGASAAGLRRLRGGAPSGDPLVVAHMRPSPRVALGQEAVRAGLRCGIDVSDGLLQDIGHICEMSALGAVVRAEAVPVSDAVRAAYPAEALKLACTGGEDYELVLVGDRERIERAGVASGTPVTVVGEMVADGGHGVRLIGADGAEISFAAGGFDHLRTGLAERPA